MLPGEEFAKKATDRVEAISTIMKISYPKPGKMSKTFSGTTTESIRQPWRWLQKQSQEILALSEDHNSNSPKDTKTFRKTFCTNTNIVCQYIPQVELN